MSLMLIKEGRIKISALLSILAIFLLFVLLISGCKQQENKKPAAPEIQNAEINAQNASASSARQNAEQCQKKGGVICNGCCDKVIFTNQNFICCDSLRENCLERKQVDTNFVGLGMVTIELFPNGKVGVWYGDKDANFGNRLFVNAIEDATGAKGDYVAAINNVAYKFTIRQSGCRISATVR